MRAINILILSSLIHFTLSAQSTEDQQASKESKRFENLVEQADRKFDRFHFKDAVDQYKKAYEIDQNVDLALKLAKTFRQLNQPLEAEFWYSQAAKDPSVFSVEDQLHYADMLKSNGNYQEALMIYEQHQDKGDWIKEHVNALKSIQTFYQKEHAYEVEWMPFNSTAKDFSPVFRNSELVFVSNRSSSGPLFMWDKTPYLDLLTLKDGERVNELGKKINTDYHEGPATFFSNGTKMFFTRNNYCDNRMGLSEDGISKLKIYYSESANESDWSRPEEFLYNSDEFHTAHPSITGDGSTLYFASDRPGGFGGIDLYRSEFNNGSWSEPVNLGPKVNTPRDEMFPYIHDNHTLYFASNGHEGLGGLDIFRVDLRSNEHPENLGYPVNTNADDFGISFFPESPKAYFSSNRPGGMGDDDIYSVFIYDHMVNVVLVDKETGEKITGQGRIDVLKTTKKSTNNGTTVPKTDIIFGVEAGTSFVVTGSSDGYYQGNLIIQLDDKLMKEDSTIHYKIPLERFSTELGAEVLVVINNDAPTQLFYSTGEDYNYFDGSLKELKSHLYRNNYEITKETYLTNILYDFDKFDIRSDAAQSLDKIVEYLNQDKELNIVLESHTDIRGSNQYNQLLAKRRVEAAKAYLLEGGIAMDRIFTGSHGEEKTLINCEGNCYEYQHQKNRRTEIRIEVNKRKRLEELGNHMVTQSRFDG